MRIDRVELSKHKRGRMLVFLEDGSCLKITEQELLDFGLRAGDELEENTLAQMKDAAGVSDTKALAADMIGRRAMSRADLEKKLREKGAGEMEIRYAVEWLEAIGALDDTEYAALLARHCADQGYGSQRVREKLYEKGVPRELWEDTLSQLPDPAGQIDSFLQGKLRGRTPDEREKKRLSDALLRRGFGWSDVKAGLRRLGANIEED